MIIERAGLDLLGRRDDGLGERRLEIALGEVHFRGGALDLGQGMDDGDGHGLAADREIFPRALRLSAPQTISGNVDRAKTVGFRAGCGVCLAHDRAPSFISRPCCNALQWRRQWRFEPGAARNGRETIKVKINRPGGSPLPLLTAGVRDSRVHENHRRPEKMPRLPGSPPPASCRSRIASTRPRPPRPARSPPPGPGRTGAPRGRKASTSWLSPCSA